MPFDERDDSDTHEFLGMQCREQTCTGRHRRIHHDQVESSDPADRTSNRALGEIDHRNTVVPTHTSLCCGRAVQRRRQRRRFATRKLFGTLLTANDGLATQSPSNLLRRRH